MKFFNFHLMPYAELDVSKIRDHGSAWVTFPNSHYDPLVGSKLYNRFLDELEYADQIGFDGVCVNEHHQTAYGLMPIPGVLAGALARSVKRAQVAIIGRALPLVNNPLNIAEEFAMLDNISEGRFIAGFVRGIGAEYHSTGVNPAESLARFQEAHDLIVRAWTETGPFEFDGEFYHHKYVNLWPRPYQNPHPPIWVPSQGSAETIAWAAQHKYTYCQTLGAIKTVAGFLTDIVKKPKNRVMNRPGISAPGRPRFMLLKRMKRRLTKPGPTSRRCKMNFCGCPWRCYYRQAIRR